MPWRLNRRFAVPSVYSFWLVGAPSAVEVRGLSARRPAQAKRRRAKEDNADRSPNPLPIGANASTDDPLSLEGEGWGEGEHTAQVVIPFTLCSLLLCYGMTCERAMAAQAPLRGALGLFLGLSGMPQRFTAGQKKAHQRRAKEDNADRNDQILMLYLRPAGSWLDSPAGP